MDWGLKNRLSRIIRQDGKTVMLAVDHGYFQGPTSRLEDPETTIAPIIEYADTLMPTRGVLRNCVDASTETPIVLRVSGGTSMARSDYLSDEGLTVSMEDAVRLNVAGVAMSIFVGSEHERQTLLNLSLLIDEGMAYGVPVVAVTAVGKEMVRDARYLALSSRIAAELGVSIVKTYYCEKDFEKVTSGCPVPIVIAGGKKCETEMDAFEMTHNAISQGAVGVDMGRNIWQDDHPVAMIKAIRAIVHDGLTAKEAQDLYDTIKSETSV